MSHSIPADDRSVTSVPPVVALTVLVGSASAGVPFPVALVGGVGSLLLAVLVLSVTPAT